MALGLDDAVLGWLVAAAGDTLLSRMRGDRTRNAMRRLVRDATVATVAQVGAHLDSKRAEHLKAVLLGHGASDTRTAVSSPAELEAALQTWIAAMDHPEYDEPGYLAALGIDEGQLCEVLTEQITCRIRDGDRPGGPLEPLAKWLWRREMTSDHGEIKQDLGRIALDLSRLHRLVEPPGPGYGGLPGETPDFTGRQDAIDELAERIQAHDPAGTVVAIHAVDGMAGVGKTELAVRAAHLHRDRYPDEPFFINLHGYTDGIPPMPPNAALEELLRRAGVSGHNLPPDLASRAARWQAIMASRRALVVLDNALDAEQVRPLLPHAAGCLVLITSRTRLADLPGARTLRLDVLPPPEAAELFCRIADQAVDSDQETVTRIVATVSGLPVAIRAVAAQVGDDYTIGELAGDLADAKLRLALTSVAGPLGAGVSAAFDTSVQRLDPLHRQAFKILGVHPGPTIGTPQFAALADMPPSQAAAMLRSLASRNLLTPIASQVGHRRWQQHDMLREYARHYAQIHMSEGERPAALDRLTAWYASVIRVIEGLWDATSTTLGLAPDVEGLHLDRLEQATVWLDAEQDNLLAYAEQAARQAAAGVCTRYAYAYRLLGYYTAAAATFQSAARIYQEIENQNGHAEALIGLGGVARSVTDKPGAAKHYEAALTIYQEIGNKAGQADALVGLGRLARATGDYPGAVQHFQAALTIYRRIGSQDGEKEADALSGLGQVLRSLADYPGAAEHFQAALTIYQKIGNRKGQADARLGLGRVARDTADYPSAAEHLDATVTIYRQIGNQNGEACGLVALGRATRLLGDYPTARELLYTGLDIYRRVGNPNGQADALVGLGQVARDTDDYLAAAEQFHAALAIYRRIGNRRGQADALVGLGTAVEHIGRRSDAESRYREALTIYRRVGARAGEAQALTGLGRVANGAGSHDDARRLWQEALAICAKIGSPDAGLVREELDRLD